jgi:hypothetical protein
MGASGCIDEYLHGEGATNEAAHSGRLLSYT